MCPFEGNFCHNSDFRRVRTVKNDKILGPRVLLTFCEGISGLFVLTHGTADDHMPPSRCQSTIRFYFSSTRTNKFPPATASSAAFPRARENIYLKILFNLRSNCSIASNTTSTSSLPTTYCRRTLNIWVWGRLRGCWWRLQSITR